MYSTDLGSAELFDDTVASSTNFILHTSGQSALAAGYYVGGFNPSVTAGRNFGGDIAEIIYYQGMLTGSDRLSVENYRAKILRKWPAVKLPMAIRRDQYCPGLRIRR